MTRRQASVAGAFYPASCGEVESMIAKFNEILESAITDPEALAMVPRAIISPHAGYIYSGFTANIAHRVLANAKPKRVIVIGPSHRVYLKGMSGSFFDTFETPCGDLVIDKEYLEALAARFEIAFVPEAHAEHSTETQMPFIRHYLPQTKVIEIVYGDQDPVYLGKMCEAILADPDNAIVISTDLSHYYPLDKAKLIDSICIKAVAELDPDLLHQGCEACGKIGVEAIIRAAKDLLLEPKILDYRTSADASGDTSAVVGYMSAAFV